MSRTIIGVSCLLFWMAIWVPNYANGHAASTLRSITPPQSSEHHVNTIRNDNDNVDHHQPYIPKYMAIDRCRNLSNAECQRRDELYHERRQNRSTRRRQRRLNPSSGDVKVLVLLMKFKDHANRELPKREYYDELLNGKGPSDVNEVGSLHDWLFLNSMGKYRATFDVRDWQVTAETEAYYAAGSSGFTSNLEEIYRPALEKLDQDGSIDWNDGYVDDQGVLNHFVIFTSGIAAEYGDPPCVKEKAVDRIWSTGSAEPAGTSDSWTSEQDFYEVGGYAIVSGLAAPECDPASKDKLLSLGPAQIAGITHEYSHGFGLIDLYDVAKDSNITIGGIGRFDTMASSQGWDVAESTPGHLCAWNRQKLGWVEPTVIDRDGYYALQPLEISSTIYKITQGYPEGEYLLIENKQPIKFDKDVEVGGMVIYKVDESIPLQDQRSYPGGPGWAAKHYKVAVLQADGRYDIEKGVNFGDKDDFWSMGQVLGSGGDFPNTDSYQGGKIQATGISIEVLSNSGFLMMFRVKGFGRRSEILYEMPTEGNTNNVTQQEPPPQPSVRNTTTETISWVLGMIMGLSVMLGVLAFVL